MMKKDKNNQNTNNIPKYLWGNYFKKPIKWLAHLINNYGNSKQPPLITTGTSYAYAIGDEKRKHPELTELQIHKIVNSRIKQNRKKLGLPTDNNITPSLAAAGLALGSFYYPWLAIPDIIFDTAASIDEPSTSNNLHTIADFPETVAKFTPSKIDDYVAKGILTLGNIDDAVSTSGRNMFSNFDKKLGKINNTVDKTSVRESTNVNYRKNGGQIRKMQTASGGPLYLSVEDIKNGANALGSVFLNGLGTVGKFLNAGFTSPTYGTTGQVSYARNALDAKRQRELSEASEQAMGKAMTWVSPLNYGAALLTGNGLNARKGGEEIEKLEPWQQALLRGTELYVGPKGIKGTTKLATKATKAGAKTAVNVAAKAGSKTAKKAVMARKINEAVKNGVNKEVLLDLLAKDLTGTTSQVKIKELYPEFEDAMNNSSYVFGRQSYQPIGSGKWKTVIKYKDAPAENYMSQFKYPLLIKNGLLTTNRPIWLNKNRPYFGTPSRDNYSNSANYTYVVDAKKFTPELNLLRDIGSAHYEYPGTDALPIEATKRILFDPILGQYTSTRFVDTPKLTGLPSTSLAFFERKPSTIQISPEELYKVLKDQELNGYYFMGHGTGRSNVNPLIIFDNGLRIKNGDIGNTTSPISLSSLSLWPHANSKEVIILPGRAGNVKFDSAHGRIPSDWYDSKTFQWDDNPGFEGSGFFAVQKPNATFVETEVNGVPGVYTKPEAILGSYNIDTLTLRLNPNSQYKFQFGKTTSQIAEKNVVNKMPNIIRTVLDNGKKIRLSLPSHTDSNPRQFVLEPQGNNKFYVHMRTWDGDHIPANLTNAEKQQLFNALYNELPEGAEILFPKSGPGNYGTRGTVAGLQRLSRDPRFTPGTKGILQYYDKDGKTIKTYEGTSFIKTPKLQYLKQGGKMNILEFLKNGSGIHIKKKNRGKFTSYCGGKVTDECILKGKNSSNPAIRKRATFAANARKWKHKEGGIIKANAGTLLALNMGMNFLGQLPSIIGSSKKSNDNNTDSLNMLNLLIVADYQNNYDSIMSKLHDDPNNPNANGGSIVRNYIKYKLLAPMLFQQKLLLNNLKKLLDMLTQLKKTDSLINMSSSLLLNGLGLLSNYNKSNKSSNSYTSSSPSYFSNYVNSLFKNYGTFNSDGSMNLGNGLGIFSIKDGYKPRKLGILNS